MKFILLISIINLTNIYAASPVTPATTANLQASYNSFSKIFNQIVDVANSHRDDYKNHIRYCYGSEVYDTQGTLYADYTNFENSINQTINSLSLGNTLADLQNLVTNLNQMNGVVTCMANESQQYNRASSGETNLSSISSQMLQDFNATLTLTNSLMNNWPATIDQAALILDIQTQFNNINQQWKILLNYDGAPNDVKNDTSGFHKYYDTYINGINSNTFIQKVNAINLSNLSEIAYNNLPDIAKTTITGSINGTNLNSLDDLIAFICQLKSSMSSVYEQIINGSLPSYFDQSLLNGYTIPMQSAGIQNMTENMYNLINACNDLYADLITLKVNFNISTSAINNCTKINMTTVKN